MTDTLQNALKQLNILRSTYQQQLPERVEQVEAVWNQLVQCQQTMGTSAPKPFTLVLNLNHLTHRLAGSSASFGFAAIGETARMLELLFKAIEEEQRFPTTEQQAQIQVLLSQLKQATRYPTSLIQNYETDSQVLDPIFPEMESSDRTIFLVEDDPHLSKDLALQISCFGYTVKTFDRFSELEEAVQESPPSAIIMDVVFPEDNLAGPKNMTLIQQSRNQPLPVLFISARNDLTARLQAVRAGGKAYFPKPIKIGELIDALDTLTAQQVTEPYRVLIIEDDAPLAAYYSITLNQAGMTTTVVTDPLQVMAPLVEFRPDLILVDMYMPGCDGLELAAVIRQQPAYVGIPIIFLSRETDFNKQLRAIALGGDDFLTKPIQPHHLIASVIPRVQRSRLLRSFMVCDSLTGLLNHTAIKERLNTEVKRAARQKTTLAFAMIDIDNFKAVNDTYGHLTGDRVLKSLSRLLQQRLRKTDIKGRYGGEEFAIILPDTKGTAAVKILDEIRAGFAQVRQQAEGAEFSVTFSCGIAVFPNISDSTQLNEAADKALYQAKRQGRNQVFYNS